MERSISVQLRLPNDAFIHVPGSPPTQAHISWNGGGGQQQPQIGGSAPYGLITSGSASPASPAAPFNASASLSGSAAATPFVEEQLHLTQAQTYEQTKLIELLKAELADVKARVQIQEDTIHALTNERHAFITERTLQSELIRDLESKVAGQAGLGNGVACVKLGLSDPSQVGPALDRVISVASAVPGMQDFIQQIWRVVNGIDENQHVELTPENLVELKTSIIPTLKRWSNHAIPSSSSGPSQFKLDIIDALRRRVHRSPLNPLHSTTGASTSATSAIKLHDHLPDEEVVFEVQDIVSNENRLNALVYDQHSSPSSFFHLWAQMDKSPLVSQPFSQDSEKIITHIQQLFDIPHRIGLFPKMNELFLFVNETRPAIQAMRSLLKLDSRATIHTCIKALKNLVEANGGSVSSFNGDANRRLSGSQLFTSPPRQESNGRGLAWTVTSPSKHEVSFLNRTEPAGPSFSPARPSITSPSHDQLQRQAQYGTICKQLKTILNCEKVREIPHAVEELLRKSQRTDLVSQSILTQLVAMLEVANITDLPSAVTVLKSQNAQVQREADEAREAAAASRDLSNRMAVKREQFIQNLKEIVGAGQASDTDLVDTLVALNSTKASVAAQQFDQKEQESILADLQAHLGVRSSDQLLSKVQQLSSQKSSYDQVYPQLDSMVSSLYDLLTVDKLAEIVPAVRRLSAAAAANAARSSNSWGRDEYETRPVGAASLSPGSNRYTTTTNTYSSPPSSSTSYQTNTPGRAITTTSTALATSPHTTTTRTSTTTTTSSLYISGASPYKPLSPRFYSTTTTSSSNPTASILSSSPSPAIIRAERERQQRELDAAAVNAELERELDRAIDRTMQSTRRR